MNTFRVLGMDDLDDLCKLEVNAYPGSGISKFEELKDFFRTVIADPDHQELYGLYRSGQLCGAMRLLKYTMQFEKIKVPVGGIGSVAVDLLHKKEKVARDMISYACSYFHKQGINMVTLYPFRVDFYKKMGFGYGAQLRQYRALPLSFTRSGPIDNLIYLTEDDKDAIIQCYDSFMDQHHGLFNKVPHDLKHLFSDRVKLLGYKDNDMLLGYMTLYVKSEAFFKNSLSVDEFIYLDGKVLSEFASFLHTQADQFERVIISTQDEYLHHLLSNPASGKLDAYNSFHIETSVNAVGLMYRVLDVSGFYNDLSKHDFDGQALKMKIAIDDDFYTGNNGSYIVVLVDGKVRVVEDDDYDVEITMTISTFSSLIMGAVDFLTLSEYGLATISNADYIDQVNKIFRTKRKPMCLARF